MQMENGTVIDLSNICGKASYSNSSIFFERRALLTNQLNQVCQGVEHKASVELKFKMLCRKGFNFEELERN